MLRLGTGLDGGCWLRRTGPGVLVLGMAVWVALVSPAVAAADLRSVSERAAVLYDAPSTRARRLYVVGEHYPLEVVVNLDDWVKVRDVSGELTWIEKKSLSEIQTKNYPSPPDLSFNTIFKTSSGCFPYCSLSLVWALRVTMYTWNRTLLRKINQF